MSEVNYRRNGMKYSSFGHHKSMAPKAGFVASGQTANTPKPPHRHARTATPHTRATPNANR